MTWANSSIEDAFEFVRNGKSIKQDKSGIGLPITRIETIAQWRVDPQRVGFAGIELKGNENWLLKNGDILFSHINSVEHVGKCAIYEDEPERLIHGMNLLALRPRKQILCPKFAYHYFCYEEFRKKLNPFVNKAVNQASISSTNLKSLSIPLPPLAEQRRIAAILDQADELRRKREESVSHVERLSQAIFVEMFGDPINNPKRWPIFEMGDIANFFGGTTLPDDQIFCNQINGTLLAKVSDMNIFGNEVEIRRTHLWTDRAVAHSATCPTGSIVIPKRGGAIGTNKKRLTVRNTALDPNLMGIKGRDSYLDVAFLFCWFLQFDLSSLVNGSSVPQLNKGDLSPLKVALPPLALQQTFADRVARVRDVIHSHRQHLEKLEALFASLQHRAFRGEL